MKNDTRLKIEKAIEAWKYAASLEINNPGLRSVCLDTVKTLEMELMDGVPRCVCCKKPFSRGMWS